MTHAGLSELWNLVLVIVARQPVFAQIMIPVAAVFFVVMAIEGVRTSILAMRRAAQPDVAPVPPASAQHLATPAGHAPLARVYAAKTSATRAARPVRRLRRRAIPTRLKPTIRRYPRLEAADFTPPVTGFAAFPAAQELAPV